MSAATPLHRQITVPVTPAANLGAPIAQGVKDIAAPIEAYGESLAKAEMQSSLVSARLDAARQLDDLKAKYRNDPDPATAMERYAKDAKAIGDAVGQTIHAPMAQVQFRDEFGGMAEAGRVAVREYSREHIESKALAGLTASSEQFSRQAAYAENPQERQQAVAAMRASIDGVVASGALHAHQGEAEFQKFGERLALYDGKVAVTKDPAGAIRALQNPSYLPDLDPLSRVQLQDQADTELRRRQREAKAEAAAARGEAMAALSEASQMLEAGIPVDPASILPYARVAQGNALLSHRFGTVLTEVQTFSKLQKATPAEARDFIAGLEQDAATRPTPETAAALLAARRFRNAQATALDRDPLTWGARQGIAPLNALNLNGNDPADAWKARIAAADKIGAAFGRRPEYLTQSERAALHDRLQRAQTPDDKLSVATMLISGLGSRAAGEFAALAPHDPVLAQAGTLMMADKRQAARDAVTGATLLAGKSKDLRPAKDALGDVRADLRQVFRLAPQMATNIDETAQAIYAARAAGRGLTGEDAIGRNGGQILKAAVQEAAGAAFTADGTQYGGLVPYRGVTVAVPSTIKADDFEPIVKGLSADQLAKGSAYGGAPQFGNGTPLSDLRNAWLVSAGNGRYMVSVTDPAKGDPQFVRDPKAPAATNHAYVLDLAQVLPWLKRGR